MTKRRFLIGGGSLLVILPAGWTFSGCDDDDEGGLDPARPDAAMDGPRADAPVPPPADAAVDGPPADAAVDGPPADAAVDGSVADAQPPPPALPFLMFTSSVAQAHTHAVTLEVSTLMTPPGGGVSRDTSVDAQHLHTVALTQQELAAIEAGQTVTKDTSLVAGHVHTFSFSRAAGTPVAMG